MGLVTSMNVTHGAAVAASLDALMSPEFFDSVWSNRHAHITDFRNDLRHTMTIDEFELAAAALGREEQGALRALKDGEVRRIGTDREGHCNLAEIYSAFADGFSLSLGGAQHYLPRLAAISRQAELALVRAGFALARPVEPVVFLSPPGASSFGAHYDTHDFLVIQCAGTKAWTLYQERDANVLERQHGAATRQLLEEGAEQIVLRPGDALHVPRGVYHRAIAGTAISLHVTLCAYPCTWRDLIVRMANHGNRLGESVPRGLLSASSGPTLDNIASQAGAFLSADSVGHALRGLRMDLNRIGFLPLGRLGKLVSFDSVRPNSRLRRSSDINVSVARVATSTARISFAGIAVDIPGGVESACFIARHETFLLEEVPEPTGTMDRTILVRDLIKLGLH